MTTNKPKHDALIKKLLGEVIVAIEFLNHNLSAEFKQLIDLPRLKVEKESFITNDLRHQLSDIVYSVPTIDGDTTFVYVLVEHQSTNDQFIALRLWQYMLLLWERHKKDKNKLPLIYPIVIYNGKNPYSAAKNLWQLFDNQVLAKKLLTEDYQLIDLQSMPDDEIVKQKNLGMMQYMLKHIHTRDLLKLWEDFLVKFQPEIVVDKASGYIYIRSFLWYSDARLAEGKQLELEQILDKHLPTEEKDNIMRTIAEKYIDEGIDIGRQDGIKIGKAEGKAELIRMMLKSGSSIETISKMTGLSISDIRKSQS
jgi:predicted transposase/invertase (TIGR01784 family)